MKTKEKVEGCSNNLRPKAAFEPGEENEIKEKMPQGVESVKRGLVVEQQRCMLAALADGSYFAVGRGEKRKLYRRSYGMGGHVVGIPVTADGETIVGAEHAIFPCPSLSMVHAAEHVGVP